MAEGEKPGSRHGGVAIEKLRQVPRMKVLATTDGSECSKAALQQLGRLLHGTSPEILLLAVADASYFRSFSDSYYLDPEVLEELTRNAKRNAFEGSKAFGRAGYRVKDRVEEGHPAQVILDVATEEDVDLIAVGAHGHTGISRFFLGSTSYHVAEHADRSVVITRAPEALPPAGPIRILAATDGSDCSLGALRLLGTYFSAQECQVELLTVQPEIPRVPTPFFPAGVVARSEQLAEEVSARHAEYLIAGAALLRDQGFAVKCRAIAGDAADIILKAAAKDGAELIVVGSHGRSGLNRFLMGSVSARIALHAKCSVLIARARLKLPGK